MKTSLSFTFSAMVMACMLSACKSNSDPESQAQDQGVEIYFQEHLHDYGEIALDGDGTWAFGFKNLGDEAIVINRVRSTCGCTIPSWPREPIEPGQGGEIMVKYNTATAGSFMKSIYVYSTASNSPVKLQVKGKVLPEEDAT